jgi:NADH:ubiquinone oxidoreductase subunit 4 (subunit M)
MFGCFEVNSFVALFSNIGMILSVGYSIWLCNRISFGNIKQFSIIEFRDLTRREFYLFVPFLLMTFIVGMYPNVITAFLKVNLLAF